MVNRGINLEQSAALYVRSDTLRSAATVVGSTAGAVGKHTGTADDGRLVSTGRVR